MFTVYNKLEFIVKNLQKIKKNMNEYSYKLFYIDTKLNKIDPNSPSPYYKINK